MCKLELLAEHRGRKRQKRASSAFRPDSDIRPAEDRYHVALLGLAAVALVHMHCDCKVIMTGGCCWSLLLTHSHVCKYDILIVS